MGRWGDGEIGEKVKGKRNKFNLSPFPFPLSPSLCPMPNLINNSVGLHRLPA
ncbi:hypothetical protein [Nostoc linckia]|uniref:hypothetical protein n=1 Tax=Nostoc linckia TaxID=92942 RepID=UPI0015D4E32C|nr:hypothetical protein [Nostoc linckia]